MSKFLPSEWMAYSACFYDEDGRKQFVKSEAFYEAWRHHKLRNPHHWEWWIEHALTREMDECYVYEMVADWIGAGQAISGRHEVHSWYEKNKSSMILHPRTRELVDRIMNTVPADDVSVRQ